MIERALYGDLNQMYTQMDFLRIKEISVRTEGGIPLIASDDYYRAVQGIYESGIAGWWNYKEYLISNGICTSEEFAERLRNGMRNN